MFPVYNPYVSCDDAKPLDKVEGDFGRTIYVKAYHPIKKVTIKSGNGAYEVWSHFGKYDGKYFAKIKISKDVSNYVVWVCPKRY